jgi:hypothetical protein
MLVSSSSVSIIVANHNGIRFVESGLQSVFKTSFSSPDIGVMEGASTYGYP